MTVCSAAKFHPAKPKPGSPGAPVLRGAALLARGGACTVLPQWLKPDGYASYRRHKCLLHPVTGKIY
jgi:hypothetical protein